MSQAILQVNPAAVVSLSSTSAIPVLPGALADVSNLGTSAAGLSTLSDLAAWIVTTGNPSPVFTGKISSVTALATPSALAATAFNAFASTVSGATLMGYGTTGDVTLKNRAGTSAFYVAANSTNVVAVGKATIQGATVGIGTGADNTGSVFGVGALNAVTSGIGNTALGYHTLFLNTDGGNNTAVGDSALAANVSGGQQVAVGSNALGLATGSRNTAVGYQSLAAVTTGTANVAIGFNAGKYATGSSELYIDDRDRTNNATEKIQAILYGVMAATSAAQTLRINAQVSVGAAADAVQFVIDGTGFGAGAASLRVNGLTTAAINNQTATLTNAPSVGNPVFWMPISIAGSIRYIPCWS